MAAVALWDAATGEALPLNGHIDAGATVDFSPDGARLATVTSGQFAQSLGSRYPETSWPTSPATPITSPGPVFSPDGNRLLTISDDRTARVWDAASGQEILQLAGHPGWVWAAAYSPDGSRIATVSETEAMLWDAESGQKLLTFGGHLNTIFKPSLSARTAAAWRPGAPIAKSSCGTQPPAAEFSP